MNIFFRSLIVCFFGFLFGCLVYDFFKGIPKNRKNEVRYAQYDKAKHFKKVDYMLNKYKFWLFHEDFPDGKCPLFEYMDSGIRKNDFDHNENVKYYTDVAITNDDEVIGFLTYFICPIKHEKGKVEKWGRIHVLCVDEKYRRQGIALKMIKRLISFFKDEGCNRTYLGTRPENTRAKNLYYSLGFSDLDFGQKGDSSIYDLNPMDYLGKDI